MLTVSAQTSNSPQQILEFLSSNHEGSLNPNFFSNKGAQCYQTKMIQPFMACKKWFVAVVIRHNAPLGPE
eukprot:scaffold144600_cov14-Prasinocladus_malaysianus.AAC.2